MDDPDVAPADSRGSSRNLWLKFWGFALLLGIAGHAVAKAGATIAKDTGLPDTVMGGFFTAVTTSLPELVTAVAAVRRGALTLAVGNIIGGNAFDILFVATADVAYRNGPIYAMLDSRHLFAVALAGLLTAVLLLGLLRREKCGIAGIGFESFLILILYAGGMALLSAWPALAGPG